MYLHLLTKLHLAGSFENAIISDGLIWVFALAHLINTLFFLHVKLVVIFCHKFMPMIVA